jgi:ubiquinone/menaquinone biosynthesis C-methylase UbiE
LSADLRRADGRTHPFDEGSFDHIWMMWFLEHVADPVAVLREARRILAVGGVITAIEANYGSTRATPVDQKLDAVFAEVTSIMDAHGHSDAGNRLAGWLTEAGFAGIDPGERQLRYTGAELERQLRV